MIRVGTFYGYIAYERDQKSMNDAIEAWLKSLGGTVVILSHQITNVGTASNICVQIIVQVL